jgi:hypothetical protein
MNQLHTAADEHATARCWRLSFRIVSPVQLSGESLPVVTVVVLSGHAVHSAVSKPPDHVPAGQMLQAPSLYPP